MVGIDMQHMDELKKIRYQFQKFKKKGLNYLCGALWFLKWRHDTAVAEISLWIPKNEALITQLNFN